MLLIYLQENTPRSNYIFEMILKDELGIEYTVTTNRKLFERYGQEKLNYSSTPTDKEFFIKASTLLFEKSIEKIKEQRLRDKVVIEVSGGIALDNINQYASSKPDIISIGSLTHSFQAIDFSLEIV